MVTPKSESPKIKVEKKARKPKADAKEADLVEEEPKRRRKAPSRKASDETESIEAAE